jgi:hypothetical protein
MSTRAKKTTKSTPCNVNLVARELKGAAKDMAKVVALGKKAGWSARELAQAIKANGALVKVLVAWMKATGARP